jgi:hypothetical protein
MPIWLRNFTHKMIADSVDKENQRYQNSYGNKGKKGMSNSNSTVTNIDIGNPNQSVISAIKNNQRI